MKWIYRVLDFLFPGYGFRKWEAGYDFGYETAYKDIIDHFKKS